MFQFTKNRIPFDGKELQPLPSFAIPRSKALSGNQSIKCPVDVCNIVGGAASPLLANILLDDLDKELEKRGLPFVRYADDFAIFAKSERAAQRIMESVTRYLTEELRLVVNQTKSHVVSCTSSSTSGSRSRASKGRFRSRRSRLRNSSTAFAKSPVGVEASR